MKKVFLDFGHGGKDPGAIGNGTQEKDLTLAIGLKVNNILRRHGVQISNSRIADQAVSLKERTAKANKTGAKALVSIHINSFANSNVNGVETFSYPSSAGGAKLAKAIQDSLVQAKLFKTNRGTKTANFHMLRESSMPAALVELGFISNLEDSKVLKTNQDEIAEAVAKGVLNYLGVKYVSDKKQEVKKHWAEKHFESLGKKGIEINQKRFDDNVKRGELFAILDRIVK